jgi:hypothetical protein
MSPITIELQPEVAEALVHLAKLRGRSEQELIQEILALYTGVLSRPMPRGAGQFDSGRPDVSSRVDELLDEAHAQGEWP